MTSATHVPHAVYDVLLLAVIVVLLWVLIDLLQAAFQPPVPVQMLAPL